MLFIIQVYSIFWYFVDMLMDIARHTGNQMKIMLFVLMVLWWFFGKVYLNYIPSFFIF